MLGAVGQVDSRWQGGGTCIDPTKEEGIVLTIIQSGSKAWAMAATNGDVRIFSREQAGEWIEVLLSEESEQLDGDGSLILEALYEQYAGEEPEEEAGEEPEAEAEAEEPEAEAEAEEPEAEEEAEEPEAEEDEEEPEAEEDEEEPESEEEDEAPEEEEEDKKPRRSRRRTRAKKK
jgi:outer membrane biosynthesis protein TonB